MKRRTILWFMILLVWLVSACQGEGRYQATLITEGEHILTGTTYGDLIMIGGETTLAEDAVLEGSAHLLSGQLNLEGTIQGNLSFLNGELLLGPTARIRGDLNLTGSQPRGLDPKMVGGGINTGSGLEVPSAAQPQDQGAGWTALRWLVSSLFLGAAGAVLESYLPRQVDRVGKAAIRHFPVSLAMGTLAGIVGLTLLVLMAYTIVLVPVAFLGLATLGLSVVYGWIACGRFLGLWAGDTFKIRIGPRWKAFVGTGLFFLLLNAVGTVPQIGGLFGLLAAAAGLGAVYLTRLGIREFTPHNSLGGEEQFHSGTHPQRSGIKGE